MAAFKLDNRSLELFQTIDFQRFYRRIPLTPDALVGFKGRQPLMSGP
jgi:hypothetical protein